jgi:YebC/PmpR family DNA-binding regulatory protein
VAHVAGHSKWHNIKIRKSRQDAMRGREFSKISRELSVAARQGGGDPATNGRLALAVARAKAVNMPNDTIERAIKRGTGELEGTQYDEVLYEGYGPGGVAMIIHALTDNRNRTVAEIRNIMAKRGGNLGEEGCVAWMFDRRGVITVAKDATDEETLLLEALEGGAEDVRDEGDIFQVVCEPDTYEAVRKRLEQAGIAIESAELTMVPKSTVPAEGEVARKLLRLLESLEENDDVQQVYANFDISDEIIEEIAA